MLADEYRSPHPKNLSIFISSFQLARPQGATSVVVELRPEVDTILLLEEGQETHA
jgi:hypothetical protein